MNLALSNLAPPGLEESAYERSANLLSATDLLDCQRAGSGSPPRTSEF